MDTVLKNGDEIRVILVEDHHVLRKGIRMLIDAQKDMLVVAEAGNGNEAVEILQKGISADVLISDLNMPEMDGYSLFEFVSESNFPLAMIAFSMLNGEKHVEKAFRSGCLGYLTKSVEAEELLFGIQQVANGKKYICSETANSIIEGMRNGSELEKDNLPPFTERELQVLELISKGMTNKEIANSIFLSKRTVEGHRQSLLDKTGSRNSAALIKFALKNGMLK